MGRLTRWLLRFLLLGTMIVLLVGPAVAQGEILEGDRAIFGREFVLRAGQTMQGDLAVFGGTVRIEDGARLNGDIALAGGMAVVAGRVDGDIAVFGGVLELEETAVVDGDVAVMGGTVTRAPGAVVKGEMVEGPRLQWRPGGGAFRGGLLTVNRTPFSALLSVIGTLVRTTLVGVVLAGLSFLVVLYLPVHTRRVSHALHEAPATSFGLGCLTLPLAIFAGFVLFITIIGIPLALIVWFGLIAAWLFGFIALGHAVGERLLRALDVMAPRPTASAVVGVVVLWLLWAAAGLVPCGGGLVVRLILISLAVGAVLLTRFGTAFYPKGPNSPANYPQLEAPDEPPELPPSEPLIPPAPSER